MWARLPRMLLNRLAWWPPPQLHHLRRGVDAIADQLRIKLVIFVESYAQDAGLAMIQRAHGVEGMRGADGAGGNGPRAFPQRSHWSAPLLLLHSRSRCRSGLLLHIELPLLCLLLFLQNSIQIIVWSRSGSGH